MATNRLQAVLDRAAGSHEAPRKPKAAPRTHAKSRSGARKAGKAQPPEAGTVLVGAHLPPAYLRQLRLLAAEEGVTSNTLIREALDLLFVKKGRERIRR